MKIARIAVLGVALAAAGGAAFMANFMVAKPKPAKVAEQTVRNIDTEQVLVTTKDIPLGEVIQAGQLRWQDWPRDAITERYITKSTRAGAMTDIAGSIARSPVLAGEPVNEAKLVKPGRGGLMSAILPQGKRAISTKISPETGAGGFILPNDKVDIILTRRDGGGEGQGGSSFFSETILENIRVLAIDQTISEQDGKKVVVGKTATVELTPSQAERLAVSKEMGELSLALRSLSDSGDKQVSDDQNVKNGTIRILRFGVASQVSTSR